MLFSLHKPANFLLAMEPVRIRPCTYQDIESVLQLDKLWEEEDVSYFFTEIGKEDFFVGLDHFPQYFLVAECDSKIVGYINGSAQVNNELKVLPKQETYLEIENIYVQPEFRNRHVGSDMIERLLEIAEKDGINRFVVSTVTKDMDRILSFYRRHGFRPWLVEMFK